MLATSIIELIEESDSVRLMVVQEKKQKDEIMICVDLRKLNDVAYMILSQPYSLMIYWIM